MVTRSHMLVFCAFLFLTTATYAGETLEISHGPMLGAVSENAAAIWIRTSIPGDVVITLSKVIHPSQQQTKKRKTTAEFDNTCIFRFDNLKKNTKYRYVVCVGKSKQQGIFITPSPSLKKKGVRMVYGYGYNPSQDKMKPGTSIFMEMASRKPDLVLFLGDFPYTQAGRKKEVRDGNKKLRSITGFRKLTASTPTYGIYDDHDFGPNDCDGTHENADEALAAFKEYWPNPSYALPGNKGIYCSFVVGDVEFFLLDGRYQARKSQKTMLGKVQFDWLCKGLRKSKSRYKVLVSGTQFGRVKADSWGGKHYLGERKKLFTFIFEKRISGVVGISGDVHRSDIYKLPIGGNRFFYDFTPGALAREQRMSPNPMPATMIHSYSERGDNNMFGEIDFHPASDKDVAIVFRSFSAKNGLVYEHELTPDDLGIQK